MTEKISIAETLQLANGMFRAAPGTTRHRILMDALLEQCQLTTTRPASSDPKPKDIAHLLDLIRAESEIGSPQESLAIQLKTHLNLRIFMDTKLTQLT